MVKIEQPKRIFKYKNDNLEDPNPSLTPDEVLDFYVDTKAELVNATVSQPKLDEEKNELVFEFKTAFKSKG